MIFSSTKWILCPILGRPSVQRIDNIKAAMATPLIIQLLSSCLAFCSSRLCLWGNRFLTSLCRWILSVLHKNPSWLHLSMHWEEMMKVTNWNALTWHWSYLSIFYLYSGQVIPTLCLQEIIVGRWGKMACMRLCKCFSTRSGMKLDGRGRISEEHNSFTTLPPAGSQPMIWVTNVLAGFTESYGC